MESDQQRRLFVAMAIMIPLAFLFSWYTQQQAGPGPAPLAGVDGGVPAAGPSSSQASPPGDDGDAMGGVGSPGSKPSPRPEEPLAEVKQVALDLDVVQYRFSTRGAGLVSAELKGGKMREQLNLSALEGFKRAFSKDRAQAPPMNLAVPEDEERGDIPLALAIRGPRSVPRDAVYHVAEEEKALRFTLHRSGFEIEKELRWAGSGHDFVMTVKVKNVGPEAAAGDLEVTYPRAIDPSFEKAGSFFGGVGNQSNAACLVDDELARIPPSDKPPQVKAGKVWFLAIDQQYFASALYPLDGPLDGKCEAMAGEKLRRVTGLFPLALGPGEERVFRFGAYVGPKDLEVLEQAPARMAELGMKTGEAGLAGAAYPHLDKLVDYGWWAAICRVLLGILKFFHSVTANWGVAIVLLTVVVKLVLLPLAVKAQASAEAMKRLQPKMEEIRKKYSQDRERQQLETMKLYQQEKVNPVGGCLPILVQLPIWFALFQTLRTSYELYREPFIAPVWSDLTFRDPTYVLPIAMGVTWILTARAQPQMVDPLQAKLMTYVMPAFFSFLMLEYPMGLALYIATNNVLTTLQQIALKRFTAKKGAGADPASGAARKPGEKHERDTGKSGRRSQRAS